MQRRRHHDRADFSSLQFTLSTGACTASLPAAEILQTLGVRGGGVPSECCIPFGTGKLECWYGYQMVKKFEDSYNRFDRIPACDRWTDRQRRAVKIVAFRCTDVSGWYHID